MKYSIDHIWNSCLRYTINNLLTKREILDTLGFSFLLNNLTLNNDLRLWRDNFSRVFVDHFQIISHSGVGVVITMASTFADSVSGSIVSVFIFARQFAYHIIKISIFRQCRPP